MLILREYSANSIQQNLRLFVLGLQQLIDKIDYEKSSTMILIID